ncbi:thioesterase family protein [Serpentinicella sp. ANB-PHB4]|uniref:acyl-CoA thioesterase n=1 Tax=Serpentinicella sp. ANB-PHB4 TaxID=3074076 RepID=UPI00285CD487|nr:thioesterase family protein [Serpentinicella sp. ANB-PHB4]MDR5658682.1 thioesterase family protein [Serpentinicella sp. ANB-PHB4]
MIYLKEIKINPRYSETDQMGIIYHANYLVWFEVARTETLQKYGINYKEMEDQDIMLPVIEANCKYKSSAKYGDEITIKTSIANMGASRVKFNYTVMKADRILAEGFTEHAFMSAKKGRAINLKKANEFLYNQLVDITKKQ